MSAPPRSLYVKRWEVTVVPTLTSTSILESVLLAPGDDARHLMEDRQVIVAALTDLGMRDLLLDYERRVVAALVSDRITVEWLTSEPL